MPTEKKSKVTTHEITVPAALTKVKEMGPSIYANHLQIVITSHEIFLDFYLINPSASAVEVDIKHLQRIILPLDLGKAAATALANVIAVYEQDHGISLLNARPVQEDDQITIWK